MSHEMPLIATLSAGLSLALLFGTVAAKLRLPAIVGYLLAGMLIGPHTPGFIANPALARELSEIGIVLLMFGVGLHFSLTDLLAVRTIAIPGAILQVAAATVMGAALGWIMGWPLISALIFGFAISIASTAVLLRYFEENDIVKTPQGHIAVGWLIVEDLLTILVLVLLPVAAHFLGNTPIESSNLLISRGDPESSWHELLLVIFKLVAFLGLMMVVGRSVIPWILDRVATTGSRELFHLAILTVALGVAFGAYELFGVSLALGAFFAGMILSESEMAQRAAEQSLPMRDAFAVLFFVSVGMLFDPASLVRDPFPILATTLIIVLGKAILAFLIVLLLTRSLAASFTLSAGLAQIGEFSFVLAAYGVSLNLLPVQGQNAILAGAMFSILLNPFAMAFANFLRLRIGSESAGDLRDRISISAPEPTVRYFSGPWIEN
jgi:monovalent cation:H+ antiporter-2, CPA2 family